MDFIFDPSLVLYLPLYELDGASFTSRDVDGHLCTVTGAVWRPNGHYFDGSDDEVNCGNNVSLDITDAITIEAWIDPSNLNDRTIVGKMESVAGGRQYAFQVDTNHLRLLLRNSADTGWLTLEDSISVLQTDVWHSWAAAWDGQALKYYLDGEADGSFSASGTLLSTNTNLRLGRNQGGSAYFNGLVGEVRIYNRALTPQEIQHNYLATKWRYR